ncbi:MAG: NADH:ubiquinone oxidoreductase [Flavobacteriales bacterium]|nr:NADH:ubiquinone oxidoreductase [Flavobacteriales bacterium]
MLENIKILFHQGKQYIPDLRTVEAPGVFRGRPIINLESVDNEALKEICPTHAISANPVQIDLGKCTFCGECALAFPNKIKFTKDYKIATNSLEGLIVKEGEDKLITLNADLVRAEIQKYFKNSLKLRQVSAGGDGSCEMELGACSNVNFDMGRYGIEFVASPRHADGIVITGPITENMAKPLQTAYEAIPQPKIVILCGVDAISGGIFVDSPAINRSFLKTLKVDLYVPGNPIHPLTFINGVLDLIGKK